MLQVFVKHGILNEKLPMIMIIMKYNLLLDSSLTKLLRQSGVPRFHGSLTPSDWVRQKERKKNKEAIINHKKTRMIKDGKD